MLNVPRWLLILVVILILLAFGGCTASFIAGDGKDRSDEQLRSDLESSDLGRLFRRLAPPSEPVKLTQAMAPCLTSTGQLEFDGVCVISIPPTGDLRRELRLTLASLTMDVVIVSSTGGERTDSGRQTIPLDDGTRDLSVVVARDDSATVTLICGLFGPCRVLVNSE